MVAEIIRKYKWDLALIGAASAFSAVLAVVAHGNVKWYTGQVASIAPLVFAGAMLLALTAVGTMPRGHAMGVTLRILINIALISLFASDRLFGNRENRRSL